MGEFVTTPGTVLRTRHPFDDEGGSCDHGKPTKTHAKTIRAAQNPTMHGKLLEIILKKGHARTEEICTELGCFQ
jgi:hypothetical protein